MENLGWMMCTLGVVVAIAGDARADGEPTVGLEPIGSLDLPFDHNALSLSIHGTGPSTFDGGTYRDGSLALRGALTLYSRLHVGKDDLHGFRLLAQFRVEGEQVDADMFASGEHVVKAGLGVTALYLSSHADVYTLYAGTSIAETRETIAHAQLMPTLIGLASYRTSEQLTWIYGGGFGYALGRSWLLPVAGVMWTVRPDWVVMAVLPVLARVEHRFASRFAGDVIASVDGDRFGFANDGAFAGAGDRLQLRLAELRLGVGVAYRWDRWSWRAELGVVAPRTLAIVDGDATVMSDHNHGAGYVSTKVSYAFGSAPR